MTETAGDDEILTRDLQRFFDRMSAHFPGHVMQRVLEPDGRVRYSYVSPGLSALGLDRDVIMREADSRQDWVHPDDAARWRAALHASAATLETLDEEVRIIGVDGRVRWVRSIGNPRRTATGAIVWDGIALDVTEKREALHALRLAKAEADAADAGKARLLAELAARLETTAATLRRGLSATGDGLLREAAQDALAQIASVASAITDGHARTADEGQAHDTSPLDLLTERQRAVVALVAEGYSNRRIAEALSISEGTAKLHVTASLKALGLSNRTEAALLYNRLSG